MPSPEEPVNKKTLSQHLELLSRVDERVKNLNVIQKKIEDQISKINKTQSSLHNKINALESDLELQSTHIATLDEQDFEGLEEQIKQIEMKIQAIDVRVGNNDSRWFLLFDSVWKVLLMLISSYILYKLGWQPPTAP